MENVKKHKKEPKRLGKTKVNKKQRVEELKKKISHTNIIKKIKIIKIIK